MKMGYRAFNVSTGWYLLTYTDGLEVHTFSSYDPDSGYSHMSTIPVTDESGRNVYEYLLREGKYAPNIRFMGEANQDEIELLLTGASISYLRDTFLTTNEKKIMLTSFISSGPKTFLTVANGVDPTYDPISIPGLYLEILSCSALAVDLCLEFVFKDPDGIELVTYILRDIGNSIDNVLDQEALEESRYAAMQRARDLGIGGDLFSHDWHRLQVLFMIPDSSVDNRALYLADSLEMYRNVLRDEISLSEANMRLPRTSPVERILQERVRIDTSFDNTGFFDHLVNMAGSFIEKCQIA